MDSKILESDFPFVFEIRRFNSNLGGLYTEAFMLGSEKNFDFVYFCMESHIVAIQVENLCYFV